MTGSILQYPKWFVIGAVMVFTGLCLLDHRVAWDWIYTHWLYDYHFGFMKRGLIGEGLSIVLGHPKVVSLSIVKAISWAIFAVNAGLVFYFFRQIWRQMNEAFKPAFLVFFAFCLLAPVSIRNFTYDLGRFDQITSIFLFLQWFAPPTWFVALGSVVSVLIHENYIFMFLPAILLIHSLQRGMSSAILVGGVSAITTLVVVKFGAAGTDSDTLWKYLLSKADAPLDHNVNLLYWKLQDQLAVNWEIFKGHIPYLPGYVFYALFCIPIYRCYRQIQPETQARWFSYLMLLGYFGILFLSDWCRSIANFFIVLMFLCLYLMRDSVAREKILSRPIFKDRRLHAAIALSLLIPATGVDLPRIYKLFEILVKKMV